MLEFITDYIKLDNIVTILVILLSHLFVAYFAIRSTTKKDSQLEYDFPASIDSNLDFEVKENLSEDDKTYFESVFEM